jgi:hypothetical protein
VNARVIIEGDEQLIRRFGNSSARQRVLGDSVQDCARIVAIAAAAGSPRGSTGRYAASWGAQPDAAGLFASGGVAVAQAGNSVEYAAPVESGRAPGSAMPPPDELVAWMAAMGIEADPFVIARSIGRKGIPARHVLANAVDATRAARIARMGHTASTLLERS